MKRNSHQIKITKGNIREKGPARWWFYWNELAILFQHSDREDENVISDIDDWYIL